MLLAMIVLIIPTVFNSTVGGTEGEKGVEQLSHIAAIVLLLLYGLFLFFQFSFRTHLQIPISPRLNRFISFFFGEVILQPKSI